MNRRVRFIQMISQIPFWVWLRQWGNWWLFMPLLRNHAWLLIYHSYIIVRSFNKRFRLKLICRLGLAVVSQNVFFRLERRLNCSMVFFVQFEGSFRTHNLLFQSIFKWFILIQFIWVDKLALIIWIWSKSSPCFQIWSGMQPLLRKVNICLLSRSSISTANCLADPHLSTFSKIMIGATIQNKIIIINLLPVEAIVRKLICISSILKQILLLRR